MTDILMPALSPTMESGTLAKWLVKVGDHVKSGDVIAEIETDKATMEVEAVDEGAIAEILVAEGAEEVKVNTPIARLANEGDRAATPQSPVLPSPPPATAPPPPAAAATAATAATETPATPTPVQPADQVRIFASPLARRLAEQSGIDLASVAGSGPHGRIIKADIVARRPEAQPPVPVAPVAASPASAGRAEPRQAQSLEQMGIPPGSYDLVPLDGMRKTVARRMTDSFRDVPHFPLTIDLELDALLAARVKINAMLEAQDLKVSVNDMVIKAAAVALRRVPEANASYTPEGIALHHHADIAMAVAIDGGLITPIIRKAETKGLMQIAAEAKDLAARARAKKLRPEEFQGGTFSVSNLGMFGIRTFASILNEPQGAILSVGAGVKRPVVRNDELAVATVMSCTLTCDHRVVDGAVGARWLAVFKTLIEDPMGLIL